MNNRKIPRVYPILDTQTLESRGIALETAAAAFLEGGAGILQFRHKAHWSRAIFERARVVARLCREAGATFIVNDRADFAMLLEAGLHVGQDDLAPRDARMLIGPARLLGFSSHNAGQICAAAAEPLDYVAFGPVFATSSKERPDPVTGLEQTRECRALVSLPLVAIGGITLANAAEVFRAGADSVAVIAGLLPDGTGAQPIRKRMEEWQQLAKAV
jgi:thiamine-phosphate pyrophosphorylase